MAYSDLADLKNVVPESQLIELTDDTGAAVVDENKINEAIESADAEIDGYLGVIYSVPLASTIPDLINKWSIDITIYNLYSRNLETIPDTREKRYESAVRALKLVSQGKLSLGIDPNKTVRTDIGGAEAAYSTSAQVFTVDSLTNYATDI